MIWATATLTEVRRPQIPSPARARTVNGVAGVRRPAVSVAISTSRSRRGCYTGSPPVPESRLGRGPSGAPMTRFLPPRFEVYIAWSAVIINSSAVVPSSG